MEQESTDRRWLDAAARLATAVLGNTGNGPTTAVLIVDAEGKRVLGRAVSPPRAVGQAELLALADAGEATEGATLYTTLEPAAHYTGFAPVTAAIAEAGITRVIAGALDPDPERAGEGLRELSDAGIEIAHILNDACTRLNEGYAARLIKNRPFVTLKLTLTKDETVGFNTPGQTLPLGAEALRFIERERAAADAVVSGAARAAIEDNDLAIHLDGLDDRAPLRVVLAGSRGLDMHLDLFARVSGVPILVVTTTDRPLTVRPGIEILEVDGKHGRPDLRLVLAELAERGINRIFVEAGAKLAESFIAGELVDRLYIVDVARDLGKSGVPAAVFGSFADRLAAAHFSEVDRRSLGEDNVRTFARL